VLCEEEEEFIQNRTHARRDSQRDGTNTLSRKEEEEEFITSSNWRGKHNSLREEEKEEESNSIILKRRVQLAVAWRREGRMRRRAI